jgi:hypothetical protein
VLADIPVLLSDSGLPAPSVGAGVSAAPSLAPHLEQNLAASAFSAPHLEQNIFTSLRQIYITYQEHVNSFKLSNSAQDCQNAFPDHLHSDGSQK